MGDLRTTVITPPPGGWGTESPERTWWHRVGVFSSLAFDMFNFFTGSFRQVGILQNMTVQGTNPNAVSACYAVDVEGLLEGSSFISGETIVQTVQDTDGNDRIAKGIVIAYDSPSGVISYSQNSSCVDTDGNLYIDSLEPMLSEV